MLAEFARIGRKEIVHAIGPRKNFKLESDQPPVIFGQPDDASALMKRVKRVKYVNDENTYGKGQKLSLCAIKVLIYIHFQFPDKDGIVTFNPKDAAEETHLCRQSVKNAVDSLSASGYISYVQGREQLVCQISGYKDNGKTAREGGRGYITLSKASAEKLLSCSHLLPMRLMLRFALDTDTTGEFSRRFSISEMQMFLPRYCKNSIIVKALETISLYTIQLIGKGFFQVSVPEYARGKLLYEKKKGAAKREVADILEQVGRDMQDANTCSINGDSVSPSYINACSRLKKLGYTEQVRSPLGKPLFVVHNFSDQDKDDLSSILLMYPKQAFLKALSELYNLFTSKFIDVSVGAVVRTLTREAAYGTG